MDMLNFDKENVVVIEGHSIPDTPLSQALVDHQLGGSTLTQLVREIDLKNKPKVISKTNNDQFDIYTFSDWPRNSVNAKLASEPLKDHLKRLILKTDNSVAANLSIKARRSLT